MQPTPQLPPRPPGRRERLRAWLRRRDRQRQRGRLLLGGALAGLMVAAVAGVAVAALLQPRFTVLELAALRLAPSVPRAQPPVEQVGPYAAFDRRYVVEFATPPGGIDAIADEAQRQRWQVVGSVDDTALTLERGGVHARVTRVGARTRVVTRVADMVRARQRVGVATAMVVGAIAGAWWVWRQLRGNPRLELAPPR